MLDSTVVLETSGPPTPSAGGAPALRERAVPEPLAALAREHARGGAYVYDLDALTARARALRAALPAWAEAFYAVKANAHAPVLEAIAAELDGFEVASAREGAAARAAAGGSARLIASGPGKGEADLRALLELGVELVNVESELELHRVSRAAASLGLRAPVALRVNPARVEVGGSMRMGGAATQFGIEEAALDAALATARSLPGVELVGLHFHAVSNNLDAADHAAYVRWCLAWGERLGLGLVDAGGGLGVAFGGEAPFSLEDFAAGLRAPEGMRLLLEPGRWLVADCGWYAAEVVDVKRVHGVWFAVLSGGINHFLLPASWDIVHRFAVLPVDAWEPDLRRPELRQEPVTVVGPLCTPEDTLARDVTVERLRAGDVIAFPHAGAYGWEFAMHEFLGRPPAGRIAWRSA